jgi:hypothetical protein
MHDCALRAGMQQGSRTRSGLRRRRCRAAVIRSSLERSATHPAPNVGLLISRAGMASSDAYRSPAILSALLVRAMTDRVVGR